MRCVLVLLVAFCLLHLSACKKNALLSRDPVQIPRDLGNFKTEHLSEGALIMFLNLLYLFLHFPLKIIQKYIFCFQSDGKNNIAVAF